MNSLPASRSLLAVWLSSSFGWLTQASKFEVSPKFAAPFSIFLTG
jgi:hypothetical protein